MFWLLTTLAFGWDLHNVKHFCTHPPKVTESWTGSTFQELEGVATTYPERWFKNTDSVSLFESLGFNTIGLVVRASEIPVVSRRMFKQLDKYYQLDTTDNTRIWILKSNKQMPEALALFKDPEEDLLILATCRTK